MNPDPFLVTLNPGTILTALVCGLLIGAAVYPVALGRLLRLAGLSTDAARAVNDLVAVSILVMGVPTGIAFYLSQTLVEYVEGFSTWPRILGRGIVFLVYVVSIAGGVLVGQRWASRRSRS